MNGRPLHIMIFTGEPSGDFHAAALIRALKKLEPDTRITGIGGPAMAGEGAQIFFPIERLSAMGLIQVIRQFSSIRQAYETARHRLKTDRPDVVVLIDYPGFNLKIAEYAKKNLNIPVCYYIAPKVWAWNASRLKKIGAYTDHVALVLPFERPIYKKMNIRATYVGNPLVDEYPVDEYPHLIRYKKSTGQGPVIGLLPGSRASEITKLLPVMLDAAKKIAHRSPDVRFLVSAGAALYEEKIKKMVSTHTVGDLCRVYPGRPAPIFERAHMIIAASGTVTLEAALCGVPTILIYKVSRLTYGLGRRLVKIKFAGLANLIVRREIMPELLQDDADPDKICLAAISMLGTLSTHKRNLAQVRRCLGTPGAPERTAKIIRDLSKITTPNLFLKTP